MFGKARVKRFNEDVGCAPAPNAYDAKVPAGKGAGVANVKSRRFQDGKEETPGPGQYLIPPSLGSKALKRSSSFRIQRSNCSTSKTDITLNNCSIRSDVFKTPCSTPRKLRRSVSTGNVSTTISPIRSLVEAEEETLDSLKQRLEVLNGEKVGLEKQLGDAMARLAVSEVAEREETQKMSAESRVEQLEAELQTCMGELRMRQEELEEAVQDKEILGQQLEVLQTDSARVSSLRSEVELLSQDNQTLEEELSSTKEARVRMEEELVEMREVRKNLEDRFQEEDAKNVFLHFTQEQLNSQVLSLEEIVKNLKVENQLLNRAIQKLVVSVGEEKSRLDEMTEQYNRENMESEEEFNKLQQELVEVRTEGKNQEIELRAQLGEAKGVELELRQENEELKEISENDKAVVKDALDAAEKANNDLTLDLAQSCRQICEIRVELDEIEMSRVGLQGEVNSLREEVEQAREEVDVRDVKVTELEGDMISLRREVSEATEAHASLLAQFGEQEDVLGQSKEVIRGMEELQELAKREKEGLMQELEDQTVKMIGYEEDKQNSIDREVFLGEEVERLEGEMGRVGKELACKQETEAELCEKMESQEEEIGKLESELATKMEVEMNLYEALETLKVGKAEVEETLLDTQGLVETMEQRMEQSVTGHRQEARELGERLRQAENGVETVAGERAALLEINTALSAQVSEGLQTIHVLQQREDGLLQEVAMLRDFMEGAQEDGEQDRIRLMQAEDEILSLQAELDATVLEMQQTAHEAGQRAVVAQEQLQAEVSGVREDLGAQLNTVKSAYNTAVEELSESKTVGRQLLDQLQHIEGQLANKHQENEKLLNDFQARNQEAWEEMKSIKDKFEAELSLKSENIRHLEMLRNNLEASLSEKTSALDGQGKDLDEMKEQFDVTLAKTEEVNKSNLRLKANLDLRATEVSKLKEMNTKVEEECQNKNQKLVDITEQKEDLERIRMKEMDMCIELRQKLAESETRLEEVESARRSMEAQQVLLLEAEGRVEESERRAEQWRVKMEEVEQVMGDMEGRMEQLGEEASYHRQQHEELKQLVEPFKEQLEGFEMEKRSILGQKDDAMGEMKKLSSQYASLLGHQNHKQKIQHVVKLKEENVGLRGEMAAVQEQLNKMKRNCARLEEKLLEAQGLKRFDPRLSFQPRTGRETPRPNKENSMVPPLATPISTKPTGRHSRPNTGSPAPLRGVNRN